ncbi:MAG: ribonuclease H-like domain-containing protein [Minisyncoccia bacterium]
MLKIVFDLETSNIFDDIASNDPSLLDMSVCCIYNYETDEYSSFTKEQLKDLWPIIEKADVLIGYNSDHFDIPLLGKYYSGDLTKIKSVDIMKDIKKSLGRRIKLDTIAEATLGKNKIGHGIEATIWWKNGEYEKVIEYCKEDVKITKEIYEYALKNGILKYKDKDGGEIKEIKIDTSNWEKKNESIITHTLFG